MGSKNWGEELIIDAKGGDRELISSETNIKAFAKALVKAIDMVAYGEPWAESFADDEDKKGHTLFQPIMTSSITGHFVDANGDFYINIFSCKSIDTKAALDVVEQFFAPESMRVQKITRG